MKTAVASESTSRQVSPWAAVVVVLLLLLGSGVPLVAESSVPQQAVEPASSDAGKLPAVQSPASTSRTVVYSYDSAGRLVAARYAPADGAGAGTALHYTYDAAGNLLRLSDRLGIYLPLVVRRQL